MLLEALVDVLGDVVLVDEELVARFEERLVRAGVSIDELDELLESAQSRTLPW